MLLGCAGHQSRDAERGELYCVVVKEHLEAFLNAVAQHADGWRLPKFVEQEFRHFLTCGVLAHGFGRLRCGECAFERLVPFSCKGRGFCPSCGSRRMTESAARLVDDVLPRVPVRQWVLSLPHRLRYVLAWDHDLSRAVLGVYLRALLAFQRRRGRRLGIRDGHSGCVTVIQRFGGGLNLNRPAILFVTKSRVGRHHCGHRSGSYTIYANGRRACANCQRRSSAVARL